MFNLRTVTAFALASLTVWFSVQVTFATLIHSPALTATAVILMVLLAPGAKLSIV